MNDSQKKGEIADRIKRLSELREELAVTRSTLNKSLGEVAMAGRYYSEHLPPSKVPEYNAVPVQPVTWPSSEDIASNEKIIAGFRREADTILAELKDLGVDSNLFKINGS